MVFLGCASAYIEIVILTGYINYILSSWFFISSDLLADFSKFRIFTNKLQCEYICIN